MLSTSIVSFGLMLQLYKGGDVIEGVPWNPPIPDALFETMPADLGDCSYTILAQIKTSTFSMHF